MRIALLLAIGCNGDTDTTPEPTGTTGDTGLAIVTDLFPQDPISPVDILWVIDGAWSESEGIGEAMDPMWEQLLLDDPSWQMGVLDACAAGSRYATISKQWRTWPPPSNAFSVGAPSRDARFRETVYSALELRATHPDNDDFLRSGASLYVLYFGDSQDASDNEVITQRDFDAWLETASTKSRVGVITSPNRKTYWSDLTRDADLQEVGGLNAAVRNAILDATGMETAFTLTETPSEPPATVEVIYRDHATVYTLDQDYTYDAAKRRIAFKKVVPPPDSLVRVIYTIALPETTTGE